MISEKLTDTELSLLVKSLGITEPLLPECCSKCRLYASLGGKNEVFLQFLSMAQFNLLFC